MQKTIINGIFKNSLILSILSKNLNVIMYYTLRSALVYPAEGKKGDVDNVQCTIEWNWYSTLQTSTDDMVAPGTTI